MPFIHDEMMQENEIEENPSALNFLQPLWNLIGRLYCFYYYSNKTPQDLFEIAVETSNSNLLQWAIHQGANVNAVDISGKTPLHHAVAAGHIEAIRLLLSAPGIAVNAGDIARRTPLHHAVDTGHIEVIRLLLSAPGIAVNAVDPFKITPLHHALAWSPAPVIHLLLTAPGILVNALDTAGETPLHYAAEKNHVEAICLLLASGIDFSVKNCRGKTAIDAVNLINSNNIREKMITQYKRLLTEGPIESLKNKAATALFTHLKGKEEYNDQPLEDVLPKELLELYHFTPQRESNKGDYFRMRAFCQNNLHLTEDEKVRHGFEIMNKALLHFKI